MNTIIMLFALPIGIYMLLNEKKFMKNYQNSFDGFYKKIKQDTSLTTVDKINLFEKMLYKNNYDIVKKTNYYIKGEKKLFSIGWLFIGIGTLYVGLIVYIVYFLYLQKPHTVVFEL